jgi:hypothetical protein
LAIFGTESHDALKKLKYLRSFDWKIVIFQYLKIPCFHSVVIDDKRSQKSEIRIARQRQNQTFKKDEKTIVFTKIIGLHFTMFRNFTR